MNNMMLCNRLAVLLTLLRVRTECAGHCGREGPGLLGRAALPGAARTGEDRPGREGAALRSAGSNLAVFPAALVVERLDSLHITLEDRRSEPRPGGRVLTLLATFGFYGGNLHLYFQRSEEDGAPGQAYGFVSQDTVENVTFKTKKADGHYEVGVYCCEDAEVFRFRITDAKVVSLDDRARKSHQ